MVLCRHGGIHVHGWDHPIRNGPGTCQPGCRGLACISWLRNNYSGSKAHIGWIPIPVRSSSTKCGRRNVTEIPIKWELESGFQAKP